MSTVYDFEAEALDGATVPLSRFRGHVLLIVNVASKCGFTKQYTGLEALYREYRDRGFEVLGFPCNQFLFQEPGTSEQIGQFCRTTYGVSFPMFARIKVNGSGAHPLYRFLKKACPGTLGTGWIKWNFTKFLVDRGGRPIARFGTAAKPESLKPAIESALSAPELTPR